MPGCFPAEDLAQKIDGTACVLPDLPESTIERKGSRKAFIDTGFLRNSVTQRILADHAFVRLSRGTVNKDGEDNSSYPLHGLLLGLQSVSNNVVRVRYCDALRGRASLQLLYEHNQ